MTATLSVLWAAPTGARSDDPYVRIIDTARRDGLAAVLDGITADRVLVHHGPTPPTGATVRAHQAADGVAVGHPHGVPMDAPRPPATVSIALHLAGGVSAPLTAWRTAIEHSDAGIDDVDAALRLAETLIGGDAVTWIDDAPFDVERARALGRRAVDLYRHRPATLDASGLARYREVPASAFNRRRLIRRLGSSGLIARFAGDTALLDAAFWDGVASRASDSEWRALTGRVAILMYHGFGRHEDASLYVVPEQRFRRQLRLLALLRRRVVSLDDYVTARTEHRLVDPRSVVLTIDDGYRDTYDVAEPLLAERGMVATLFVPSDRVGQVNDWTTDGPLAARPLASAALLRRVGPVRIGSHARTHPVLPDLDDDTARQEIAGSRDDLESLLGHRVGTFAYPYGDEDDRVRRIVRDAGYEAAVSSRGGKNLPTERLDSLRRIEIRGTDPLWRFALAVMLGAARPVRTFRRGFRR